MDALQFDSLTRACSTSRRGTLKTLLGGALGVLLAGRCQEALACKNFGKKCERDNDCCAGMKCQSDKCRCENGFIKCGARCYDLANNEANCGACDVVCGAGETCCDGECVDLNSDRDHCGACDAACAADEICLAGACSPCSGDDLICGDACCSPLRSCCDGQCVDHVQFNANHCGTCGHLCPRICAKKVDDPTTCSGQRCCSAGECLASLEFDWFNCGECGHACAFGESCCDGACVDLRSDDDHCGACGNACRNGRVCCDGRCSDLDSDVDHCGECGWRCSDHGIGPEGSCCAGKCCGGRGGIMRCCEDQCVDVGSDPFNCGECGLTCASLVCCAVPGEDPRCCPPLFTCGFDGECLPPD